MEEAARACLWRRRRDLSRLRWTDENHRVLYRLRFARLDRGHENSRPRNRTIPALPDSAAFALALTPTSVCSSDADAQVRSQSRFSSFLLLTLGSRLRSRSWFFRSGSWFFAYIPKSASKVLS